MESQYWPVIKKAYNGFNERNIEQVFSQMDSNVHWPKAFDGGYVVGFKEIREYWTKQWSEINPKVEPISISEQQDGRVEVLVHQLVKTLDGDVIYNGEVKHLYAFTNGLIARMDIGSKD